MRYRVIGDIVNGAFTHVIEAESADEALEKVRGMPTADLDTYSSEREFARPDTAEEMAEGEEL